MTGGKGTRSARHRRNGATIVDAGAASNVKPGTLVKILPRCLQAKLETVNAQLAERGI